MTETEWVDIVADELRKQFEGEGSYRVETQFPLPYGYEVIEFDKSDLTKTTLYKTDLIVLEDLAKEKWKPRLVVEAKIGSITTHDAITYSKKASSHKSVCPYLR